MNGASVLGDSGIPCYAGEPNYVDYFRGPAAHNTVEVSEAPLAKVAGRLAWSNIAPAPRLTARLGNDSWLAKGSLDLRNAVRLQRFILGIPQNGVWVVDWIKTPNVRDVTWYWQLNSKNFQCSHPQHFMDLQNDQGVTIKTWSEAGSDNFNLQESQVGSPIGWSAPGYGVLRASSRISMTTVCTGSLLRTTFIGRTLSSWKLERLWFGSQWFDLQGNGMLRPGNATKTLDAEIAWTLTDGNQARTYLAGMPKSTGDTSLTQLLGAGDWSAACIDHAVTEFPDPDKTS
jgi:Heparinase II/III-like protein